MDVFLKNTLQIEDLIFKNDFNLNIIVNNE
jgi:hypothetical protein